MLYDNVKKICEEKGNNDYAIRAGIGISTKLYLQME